jgi:hypothetical protein
MVVVCHMVRSDMFWGRKKKAGDGEVEGIYTSDSRYSWP